MTAARLCIEDDVSVAQALARGVALWRGTTAMQPVSLYAATLRGEALVLGAHQRASATLSASAQGTAQETLRRQSGGMLLQAGEGITYLALGLYERSALMTCPKLRILNRNVRGALAGLRLAGVAAHYFGRDFLSIETRPGAYVGWDCDEGGHVLLELFVSETRTYLPPSAACGLPARTSDPLRGKQPITLREANAKDGGRALIERLAQGYAAGFGVEWQSVDATAPTEAQLGAQRVQPAAERDDGLTWCDPLEEAIGFVQAGVTLDASGHLARVQLAGDFFQDRGAPGALQRALQGAQPRERAVGEAIDAVFSRAHHELEGVRELGTLREAILTAAARAERP